MPVVVYHQATGRIESINTGWMPPPAMIPAGMAAVFRDEPDIDPRRERLDPAFPEGPLFDLPEFAIEVQASASIGEMVTIEGIPDGALVSIQSPNGYGSNSITKTASFVVDMAGTWTVRIDHNDYAPFERSIEVS